MKNNLDELVSRIETEEKEVVDKLSDESKAHAGTETADDIDEFKDLFESITRVITGILRDDGTTKLFESIRHKLNMIASHDERVDETTGDISAELCQLIVTSVTYSLYSAIGFYDSQLKEALSKDLQSVAEVINRIDSDVEAYKAKVADLNHALMLMKAQGEIDKL